MRPSLPPAVCLVALTMFSPAAAEGTNNLGLEATGTPPGFEVLEQSRTVLVDVYFGDQKVGETLVSTGSGTVKFHSPSQVFAQLADVVESPQLNVALASPLAANSALACSKSNSGTCGVLEPEMVGIIFDEDRFRVDIFVASRFLKTKRQGADGYLPVSSAPASLTSAIGVAAAGTLGGRTRYNIQNRTVIGLGNARLRTSNSLASGLGWVVDDFVAEVDRKDSRYSAGLFWAPGNDFTGQRRIVGAGFATQFDTAADRDSLQGTPLVLFLTRPARVEILIDGRLVASRSYAAGNNELDTSGLPDGAYSVLLQIHEEGGHVRSERRLFVKNARIAPLGHPMFFAFGGLLAGTRAHRPVAVSDDLYYQTGVAVRLSRAIAIDVSAMGTQRKTIVEAGGWWLTDIARVRLAGITSTAGDAGALVQLASGGNGTISFNLDFRQLWSGDGHPLIPLPSNIETFDGVPPVGSQLANGSYTQAVGSVGLRLGDGYISLVGAYRKDHNLKSDYNIGPVVSWPIVMRNGYSLVFHASAQRTRTTTAGFGGVRILFNRGSMSMSSSVGRSIEDDRRSPGGTVSRTTGSLNAQYSTQTDGGSTLTGEIGTDRDIRLSTLHGAATVLSPIGNGRIDLVKGLRGDRRTQYDVSFQSGLALSPTVAAFGARQTDQSAIVVAVDGAATGAAFKVMINDVQRAEVKVGQRTSVFVPAYRTYTVRLVPLKPMPVEFDAGSRSVTLYPGNVQTLGWKADRYFTLAARAVSSGGSPIENGLVQTQRNIAETDANGYFQIDLRDADTIKITKRSGEACKVVLPPLTVQEDFASVGKVICE